VIRSKSSSRFRPKTLIRENDYIGEFTDYSKNQLGGCADDEFFETIESFVPFKSYRSSMYEQAGVMKVTCAAAATCLH